jgi:hypothetical protein
MYLYTFDLILLGGNTNLAFVSDGVRFKYAPSPKYQVLYVFPRHYLYRCIQNCIVNPPLQA